MTAGDPYALDVVPTPSQYVILCQLMAGDRIIVTKSGASFELKRAKLTKTAKPVYERIVNNQWARWPHPDGPLFGRETDGTIIDRGRAAHCKYLENHPNG